MPKHEKVTDDMLVALIEQEKAALNTEGLGVIEAQRAAANLAYAGVYTNDLAPSSGMSTILINVVQPVVDTLWSHCTNVAASDKESVVFMPSANKMHPILMPNGETIPVSSSKVAEQTTKIINHVIHKQNDGYDIISTGIKSALLNKNAFWKTTWEEKEISYTQTLMDMAPEEVLAYISNLEQQGYECEVIEEEIVEVDIEAQDPSGVILSDIDYTGSKYVIKCMYTDMKPMIECVPPEEFMINDEAIKIDRNDDLCRFMAHRHLMTIGDISKRWPKFDTDMIGEAGPADDLEYDYEKLYRNSFDGTYDTVPNRYDQTGPNRLIEITESWMRADRDGDGYAEWVHSFSVGNNLIETEEWDGELPFATFTFWQVAHKLYGLGVYDKASGYHRAKTGIVRQMIDHGTLANTPRFFGNPEYVNERNFQQIRPGLIKTRRGFQASDIVPVQVGPGSPHTMAMLQYLDQELIKQFGIDTLNGAISSDVEKSGNDAEKTQMVVDNASAKVQSYIRNFAEMGMKNIIWQIYSLLLKNKDTMAVKELVEVVTPGVPFLAAQLDPKEAMKKDDLVAKVGLGHLTGQEKIRNLGMVQQTQMSLMQVGQLTPDKLLHTASEIVKAAGFMNTQDFINTPQEIQQMQQQQQQAAQPMQQMQMQDAQLEMGKKDAETKKILSEIPENQMKTDTGYAEQERKQFATELDAEVTYHQMQMQAEGKPVTQINTKIG